MEETSLDASHIRSQYIGPNRLGWLEMPWNSQFGHAEDAGIGFSSIQVAEEIVLGD